uniref:Uncharacterized protein n=1 Tax=Cacopsylla melanoneura TaxID=428564 RepID=A0A8D9EYP1_9HEMI
MPAHLLPGQSQLSTEDANSSRIVTKSRWIVEARNGHLRSGFKFLAHSLNIQNAKKLNSYYLIAGAILNRYHPIILMQDATVELAREMIDRSNMPNVVQARIEVDNLTRRTGDQALIDFPVLDLEYLSDLTVGTYQVNLASSYIQDKLIRDNDEQFQIDENLEEPGFLRIRVYSRFRNATKHQVFIAYIAHDAENREDHDENVENSRILVGQYY